MIFRKMGKRKKEDFCERKEKKKQNIVTVMISADGERTVFPVNFLNKGI